jgi:hypothetical protein
VAIYYPRCVVSMKIIFDPLGEGELADAKTHIVDAVVPMEASVGLNGYNLADSFEISFLAITLPLSPEHIIAAGVDIYLFQTEKLEQNVSGYLVPKNLVISGIADEVSLDYSDGGKFIRMSGRDYTALFLDKKWPAGATVDTGKDLKSTIELIVKKLQGGKGVAIEVIDHAEFNDPHVVTSAEAKAATAAKKSATKPKPVSKGRNKTTKRRLPVPSGKSFWDVIYDLCLERGVICYIYQTSLIIQEPQGLEEETRGKAVRYAYGRNLSSVDISRKLGHHAAVPQVMGCFYDPETKKHVEVSFPEKAKRRPTGAGTVTETFRRVTLPHGIADKETAVDYCRGAYHMYGRSEATFKFSTSALSGLEGGDLLQLRPGAPVVIGWDGVELDLIEKVDNRDQRIKMLRDAGLRERVANVVADLHGRLDSLRRAVYTKTIGFKWNVETGIDADITAINYIFPKRETQKKAA